MAELMRAFLVRLIAMDIIVTGVIWVIWLVLFPQIEMGFLSLHFGGFPLDIFGWLGTGIMLYTGFLLFTFQNKGRKLVIGLTCLSLIHPFFFLGASIKMIAEGNWPALHPHLAIMGAEVSYAITNVYVFLFGIIFFICALLGTVLFLINKPTSDLFTTRGDEDGNFPYLKGLV
jgi:hypothetical protein